MPVFMTGDMWSVFDEVDYFVITTNAIIKRNGAVVMGAGIAKQMRDKYPGIDVEIGKRIKAECGSGGEYGLLLGNKVGAFQVKHHYKDMANLYLIKMAATSLEQEARANPDKTYALNYPGIGNGGLAPWAVAPLLQNLPDNVQIWTFK
jgi:hypothetical protein